MMDRRTFLAGAGAMLLAAPFAAEAQQAGKVYRIGWLGSFSPANAAHKSILQNFHQGLRDLGYVEGRDFVMEYRFAEGQADRLPGLAADLVRAHVDVIVTGSTPATLAAMQATNTIPIVSPFAGNLVATGIVKSLARPGGNVTGLTTQVPTLKLYQLLKEAAPRVTRVVYLYDPASSRTGVAEELASEARAANVELQVVALRDPNNIAQAFAEFRRGTNGLVLDRSGPLLRNADEVCKLALQGKLPTATRGRQHADAGCLMSYGENLDDMARRAAAFVDKILKGSKPADLPVEQPTKFELIINLKTAKVLGLTIPPSLLSRADEVIQ
jgi:putative ABC transport system substrate-binding protein